MATGQSLFAQVHRIQRRGELLTNGLHHETRKTSARHTGHIISTHRFANPAKLVPAVDFAGIRTVSDDTPGIRPLLRLSADLAS